MSPLILAVFAVTVVVGAMVQATVGLGVGLVFAPVVAAVEPALMPALPLCLGAVTPALSLLWERRGIDWGAVGILLPTRAVGTVLGVWVVVQVPPDRLGIVVAVMVLAAVALSLRSVRIPDNRLTLAGAGAVAGVTGTTTSIAGPPVALVVQHRPPERVRPTLAVFFCFGALLSLVGLAFGGRVTASALWLGLLLVPCVLLGVWLGALLRSRLRHDQFRSGVLLVCGISGLALLVRSLV